MVDDEWKELVYDISAIADHNPSVRIRLELSSDQGLRFGGWAIDDVRLFSQLPPVMEVADGLPTPARLALQALPNPIGSMATLRLSIPAPGGSARVRIMDAAGRLVRSFEPGAMRAGVHPLVWNGKDSDGRDVPAGVYFASVTMNGEEAAERLLVLR